MKPVSANAKRLLIAGATHIDDVARAQTPLIKHASNVVSWTQHIGGVAANAACSAARALTPAHNANIEFLAAVGDDAIASQLVSTLETSGITTRFKRFANTPTGRYSAVMGHDGELFIGLSDVSLAERLEHTAVEELSSLHNATAILLDANLSQECLTGIALQAKQACVLIAAMSVSPVKTQRLVVSAPHIDLLFCNRREAHAMIPHATEGASLISLADGLSHLGFSRFVLTDGQAPVMVQDGAIREQLSVKHIDCTHHVNGAGDALAGATFAAWATGTNLVESVQMFGLKASNQVVTGEYLPARIGNPATR